MATTIKKIHPASIYIVRSVYNTPKAAKVSYPNYDKMYVENESTTALNVVDNCFMFKSEECANITKDAVLYLNTTSTKGLYDTEFVLSYCNNDISKIDTPVMNDFASLTQISSDDSVKSGVTLLPVPMSSSQALYDNRNNLPKGLYLTLRYAGSSDVLTVIYNDVYIQYTCTEPEISTFTVTGTSIDSDVTCSWTGEDIASWTVQAKLNGSVVATKTGTSETSCTFNTGELKEKGTYTFEIVAVNDSTDTKSTDVTLSRIEPNIIALEPSNISEYVGTPITVSWTTQNQHTYKLVLEGKTYSGTTATSVSIPANTLTAGNKSMTLTITYTSSWGDVRTTSKTVSFLAYGNPSVPKLDENTIYNTATPTFTWDSSEQVAYEFLIKKSNQEIVHTDEIVSLDRQYYCDTVLENNSSYTVYVRVKNQYNLWSEWSSKNISTSFVVPEKPTLALVATDTPSIVVSYDVPYTEIFAKAEIWRKTNTTKWIRIAYNLDRAFTYEDKFIGAENYSYKIRAIGSTGGIAESDIQTINGSSIKINDFHFTNIEDFSQEVVLVGNPVVRINNNVDIKTTLFAGCVAPKIEKGLFNYRTGSLSFSIKEDKYEQFINLVNSSRVLLYRDGRQRKFYCQLTSYPSITYNKGSYITISFTIAEVAFVEGNFYYGNGCIPPLLFDGTWYFDGSEELDGEK